MIVMDLYFYVMEFPILFIDSFLPRPFLLPRWWRLGIVDIQKRNRSGSNPEGEPLFNF